ncbi:MAG: helix-turn-helix transcriptional regulator [Promicromonosporaceae bacterium]|nr:helix-turn-helix transcriptional regulator [Promicromonosporaceae bacterium]
MARTPQAETLPADRAEAFRQRVRELRAERQFSQQKLAEVAGVSIGTVRAIEGAQCKDPGIFTVDRIAHALDCSIDSLVDLPTPPARAPRTRKQVAG